ncbi:hypothetical protein D3C80_1625140 [compost metagenome]
MIVNEVNKLNKVAIITTTQNSRKILETSSLVNEIGKNTTTITNVMEITVNPISLAPSNAALTRFLPISMWR